MNFSSFISRAPSDPSVTTPASSGRRTVGRSAAPEAVARLPPIVALFCTAGAPLLNAASQRAGRYFLMMLLLIMSPLVTQLPILIVSPTLLIPLSSLTLLRSIIFLNEYFPFFMSGMMSVLPARMETSLLPSSISKASLRSSGVKQFLSLSEEGVGACPLQRFSRVLKVSQYPS